MLGTWNSVDPSIPATAFEDVSPGKEFSCRVWKPPKLLKLLVVVVFFFFFFLAFSYSCFYKAFATASKIFTWIVVAMPQVVADRIPLVLPMRNFVDHLMDGVRLSDCCHCHWWGS
ncbi:hypothetical protein HPP92_016387 [Vanilla planifolia]|uniref:Uncharacterized protein n=1 Tax=Vanilla planifolia TaxID=51239 RepID=A0A835UPY3_VANPL|nr:hypothetical protein HPP92_016387 [Vanilla planifolia]